MAFQPGDAVRIQARLTFAALLTFAVPAWAGEVKVSFSNGLVTVLATDASPRQILAEWAKLGQVRIVNLERLGGAPVTVQMTDVPEARALETLLRGTAGFVAAPRADSTTAGSQYDRILLLPGVAPAIPVTSAAPTPTPATAFGRGRPLPAFEPGDDESATVRSMPYNWSGSTSGNYEPGQGTNRQVTPGQATMPGVYYQSPVYPGMPTAPAQGTQQAPATQFGVPTSGGSQRLQPTAGATVPGVATVAPVPASPYPSPLPDSATETPAVPAQGTPAATSPARPGETAGPAPATFRNPYGLPEPMQPPVVNPNANPYGLPNPPKPPAPAPQPTGPIKKSDGAGGQN